MKIALTGHTSGFGFYIKTVLEKMNHEIIGFSHSNGYELGLSDHRNNAIIRSADCDVFINNSSANGNQPFVFIDWYKEYNDQNKTIINIGSDITKINSNLKNDFLYEYMTKTSLLHMVNQAMLNNNLCKIEYLSWGYWKDHKIAAEYPQLITETTIDEAIQEIVNLL